MVEVQIELFTCRLRQAGRLLFVRFNVDESGFCEGTEGLVKILAIDLLFIGFFPQHTEHDLLGVGTHGLVSLLDGVI